MPPSPRMGPLGQGQVGPALGILLGTCCVPGLRVEAGHRDQYALISPVRVAERPVLFTVYTACRGAPRSGPICAGSACGLTTARFTEERTETQTEKATGPRSLSLDTASRKEMSVIVPVVVAHTDCTC